jgi:hypothetical protein
MKRWLYYARQPLYISISVSLALVILSVACGGSASTSADLVEATKLVPTITVAKATTVAPKIPTSTVAEVPEEEIPEVTQLGEDKAEQICQDLNTDLVITCDLIKAVKNPVGEGIFLYVDQAIFSGVERYFMWIVIEDEIFVPNGTTKNITPDYPYSYLAPYEIWSLSKLKEHPAPDLIAYIFNDAPLEPTEIEQLDYEVVVRFSEDERFEIYNTVIDAEDRAYCEFIDADKDTQEQKMEEYVNNSLSTYGLSEIEWNLILMESAYKNWPLEDLDCSKVE